MEARDEKRVVKKAIRASRTILVRTTFWSSALRTFVASIVVLYTKIGTNIRSANCRPSCGLGYLQCAQCKAGANRKRWDQLSCVGVASGNYNPAHDLGTRLPSFGKPATGNLDEAHAKIREGLV